MLIATLDLTTTNTPLQVYLVPNGQQMTGTLTICNRNSTDVAVSLQVSTNASPDNSTYVLFQQVIYPNDNYTVPGIVLDSGQYIFATTNTTSVNVVLWGFVGTPE